MKGSSNSQPSPTERIGDQYQTRWNIVRNNRINPDNTVVESWDYEYANCNGDSYAQLIEGIIRSKYSVDQVEAILANYLDGIKTAEYMEFQKFRTIAKSIANGASLKSELDLLVVNNTDRVNELEATTTAIIQTLNDKGITP